MAEKKTKNQSCCIEPPLTLKKERTKWRKMFLHVENKHKFLDLHLTSGLHDWDMNVEVNLATTTDQYCTAGTPETNLTKWRYVTLSSETSPAGQEDLPLDAADREDSVQPSLWLMVNPNLACPIIHPTVTELEMPKLTMDTPVPGSSSSTPGQNLHTLPLPGQTSLDELPDESPDESLDESPDKFLDESPDKFLDAPLDKFPDESPDQFPDESPDEFLDAPLDESWDDTSLSSEDQSPDPNEYGETSLDAPLDESQDDTSLSSEDQPTEVDVSVANVSRCHERKGAQRCQRPRDPTLQKLRGAESRLLPGLHQASCELKVGEWPRPPVNLCVLIGLALSCSPNDSLSVQQIYSFIREHFPAFMKASDGWKNSVRHNLCFSINFEKTGEQVYVLKRMSCLWCMTPAGRRRLGKKIRVLTAESLTMLKRSMRHPGILKALFKL